MSEGLLQRYEQVRERVARSCQRIGRAQPVLIAVSKGQSASAIEELFRLGHRDFGENYAQELLEKARQLSERGCGGIRWHFIGHLQTNKVKALAPHLSCVHSVDSERLARELGKRVQGARLPIFIEVNIDSEPDKSGLLPEDAPAVSQAVASDALGASLDLLGLMCVPRVNADPQVAFARLQALELNCRPATQGMLSMGMSHDFEAALEHGSTHIRVGTALFGPRVI